jgi:hypothetical protein
MRTVLRNDLFDKRLTDRITEIATDGRGAVINGFVAPATSDIVEAEAAPAEENAEAEAPAETVAVEAAAAETADSSDTAEEAAVETKSAS